MDMEIRFRNPDRIVPGEDRSKLLATDSELHRCLTAVQAAIRRRWSPGKQKMELHIEVAHQKREHAARVRARAEALQGALVSPADPEAYQWSGTVLFLPTPEVDGYGETHITVCHFGATYAPEDPAELKAVAAAAAAAYQSASNGGQPAVLADPVSS
mmetsp:Transcript_34423/g.97540  ORF Transcript_34423/g.97540 Transcript_34423/m.97540 type:complete len:157 (+) Transcript_34423:239-709(+)|eukprot:CAMPEP_0117670750 /NCGR_PEP_ID=MMETSP0804-20121206/12945_1 /TAXON_ID=1074897 /ORGANISM="Tetraselmis astigmatica, Strain CCMP880" /LENGTH=156 /DNA_ID=CAMNT_0005479121 /DNA_START=167 /DNA_END=637 /DNA_ORIENTATION=-